MRLLNFVIAILLWPMIAFAAFDKLDIGGRPVAMGGAFVAVADDIYSIYYNPAGLANVKNINFMTTYNKPYNISELTMAHAAVSYSLKEKGTIGLGYKVLTLSGYYTESTFSVAHGFNFRGVKLGYAADVKVLTENGEAAELKGKDVTMGFNVGSLINIIPNKLQFGVYFMNINNSRISDKYPEATASSLEAGIAFLPNSRLTIGAELYKDFNYPIQFKFGQEFRLNRYLILRSGFQTQPSRLSLGFGFNIKDFEIDYAYFDHPSLYANHFFTFTMKLGGMAPVEVSSAVEEGKININKASVGELMQLPRIGASIANRIVEYREQHNGFKSIEEIQKVKGIGPATFRQIKDLITVGEVKKVEQVEKVPEEEKIDINTASEVELQSLPTIGPSKSRAIVQYREQYGAFKKIEDIMNVRGIGPASFAKFKHLIKVGKGKVQEEKAPEVKEKAAAQPKLNINTATYEQLITLPGMTPNIANYIVKYRKVRGPFNRKEDLLLLPVVNRALFDKIKDRIEVTKEVFPVKEEEKAVEEVYKLDVNTAGAAEFEEYGIGEEFANKIVEYRKQHGPYKTLEEVRKAAGMDKTTFELIKDFLMIKPVPQQKKEEPKKEEQKKEEASKTTTPTTQAPESVTAPETEAAAAKEESMPEVESNKLNINKATVDELVATGFSEEEAKKIVDFVKSGNKFKSVDELQKVGIAPEVMSIYKDILEAK